MYINMTGQQRVTVITIHAKFTNTFNIDKLITLI